MQKNRNAFAFKMPTLIEVLKESEFHITDAGRIAIDRGLVLGDLKNRGCHCIRRDHAAQVAENLAAWRKTHTILLPAIERYIAAAILATPGNKEFHSYLAGHIARLVCLRGEETTYKLVDELAVIAVKVITNMRVMKPDTWSNFLV